MGIVFDPEKSARNLLERGLSFDLVEHLDWGAALIRQDTRRDYGEARLQVLAMLNGRLHAAVVTPRGVDLRVISFRKANERETRAYEKEKKGRPGVAPG
jgi:uncharacterized protein